jgi:hypothetical protein
MRIQFYCLLAAAFLVSACGPTSPTSEVTRKSPLASSASASVSIVTPPPIDTVTTGGVIAPVTLPAPLQYEVSGIGNHAKHLCIPAQKTLKLRMRPQGNGFPLAPVSYSPKYSDGTIVYDGSPADYHRLRVRMSVGGGTEAWDFEADVGKNSVVGDYSSQIGKPFIVPYIWPTEALKTPEYSDVWILGSSPNDGLCSHWEYWLGKCSRMSAELIQADMAVCNSGETKVYISKIVSDYPCRTGDKVNWCKGGAVQIVPDSQHWFITVEAVTENTGGFK